MRKLARIVVIDSIQNHPDASRLALAYVDGWQIVVEKDRFLPGDYAVFYEIDSWVPKSACPTLGDASKPTLFKGIEGSLIRTIYLRKQVSQGYLQPIRSLPLPFVTTENAGRAPTWHFESGDYTVGDDLTQLLGVLKWEPELDASLAGVAKGKYPSIFPKTHQERIQNLGAQWEDWAYENLTFIPTEKLEGQSMTAYLRNNEFGVASHNLDLEKSNKSIHWNVALDQDLESKLRALLRRVRPDGGVFYEDAAFQGELIGPGIEGNIYGLKEHQFRLFSIVMAKGAKVLGLPEVLELGKTLNIPTVPVISKTPVRARQTSQEDFIAYADGESCLKIGQMREGVVFYCLEKPGLSFKSVSAQYLGQSTEACVSGTPAKTPLERAMAQFEDKVGLMARHAGLPAGLVAQHRAGLVKFAQLLGAQVHEEVIQPAYRADGLEHASRYLELSEKLDEVLMCGNTAAPLPVD